jgi:hypothetical protein
MTGDLEETETSSTESSAADAAGALEATPQLIDRLHSAGVLSSKARVDALTIVNGPLAWWPWVEKALLFLGLALTLSGVVCFFAWNWDALPGLARLAIVQAGIVACCGAAYQKKIETLPGKAAITAAAVLVGVFLAVFGQVYQTGADAYQLFVGWALLILPWVLMCRLAGLWVLWLAIVNVAVSLFWEQVIDPRGIDSDWLPVALGLLNGIAAAIREWLAHRGCQSLPAWTRRVLVSASLAVLVVPGFVIISDFGDASAGAWCGLIVFLISMALLYWQFRLRTPDLFVLTCGATAIALLVCAAIVRVLIDVSDEAVTFFLSGLVILSVVALMTHWLMKTGREIRAASASNLDQNEPDAATIADTQDADVVPQVTVGELFAQLSEQGHLSESGVQTAVATLAEDAQNESTPWFVHSLIGFGAWLSCLLFLVALGMADLLDEGLTSVVTGVVLLGGGASLDRLATGIFTRQLGLAAGLTGLGLLSIGTEQFSHGSELASFTLGLSVATAAFYGAFRCEQFRFLSCLITVAVASVWLHEDSLFLGGASDDTQWGIHILVLVETLGIGLIFTRLKRNLLQPAGYAMAVGLLGTLLVTQLPGAPRSWPSAVVLAFALAWILRRAMTTGSGSWTKEGVGVAAVGTVLLGALSVPGVLASIGATLLGHLERDTVLKRLGLLFLPVYIAAYYYNLETSLLIKSLVLIGSGVVLWAARWYVKAHLQQTDQQARQH